MCGGDNGDVGNASGDRSLIQCFDWKVKGDVDLRQGPGFAAGMAAPLVCYPVVHVDTLEACKK